MKRKKGSQKKICPKLVTSIRALGNSELVASYVPPRPEKKTSKYAQTAGDAKHQWREVI
jgi:hypothetical protein